MIKGINKKIIEINNINNDYFEKAIFYIKNEKIAMPKTKLVNQADKYLNEISSSSSKLKYNKQILLIMICTSIVTIGLCSLSFLLFFK